MNGLRAALKEAQAIGAAAPDGVDLVLCPPATLLDAMTSALSGSPVATGGQDCHGETSGAHTGDISAAMLADLGARYVIVGHSERRGAYAETSAMVAAKARAAVAAGLTPIICVGESQDQRDAGDAIDVVCAQVRESIGAAPTAAACVVAYEPIWAIGTGRTPTPDDVAAIHAAIHATLKDAFGEPAAQARILYGGSVKPENAAALLRLPHVGGALVGGASLKAAEFLAIVRSATV
jgi:triosephosphate isomerase